jgi:probable HAF family extracellular repeat protein
MNNFPAGDSCLSIVGVCRRDAQGNSGPSRGFAWQPWSSASPTVMGTLGGYSSWAIGVNESGDVVGWADTKRSGQQAFLYRNGQMLNLNDWVDTGRNILQRALDINEDGDIVGFMRVPRPINEQRGFLLKPLPENPSE